MTLDADGSSWIDRNIGPRVPEDFLPGRGGFSLASWRRRLYLKNEPALVPVPDSSFELPDTGGSGAAAFYIAGMALAASVLVSFFARKRRET